MTLQKVMTQSRPVGSRLHILECPSSTDPLQDEEDEEQYDSDLPFPRLVVFASHFVLQGLCLGSEVLARRLDPLRVLVKQLQIIAFWSDSFSVRCV
jgi:hypothetical protein